VNWDTTPKTTTVTAASGVGYFVDTTSGAITVNLPAGSAGDIVAISDYANTSATNNITIDPDGTDKINGLNQNATISTNGVAVTLIYVDSIIGWKDVNDATLDVTGINLFVAATGGTILTCGDFKTHVFTGPGTFTVTNAGQPTGSNSVEYMVVAGGGGASGNGGGGGGAGGFRQNFPSPTTAGIPVSVQGYPITVGSGGNGTPCATRADSGNNSVFSTITSTGGGGGGGGGPTAAGASGGSGGGSHRATSGGSGNTPPTSPPQGNPGASGDGSGGSNAGGGGGGAVAGIAGGGGVGGGGGAGSPIATTVFGPTAPSYGTPGPAPGRYFAGGGGGGGAPGGAGGAGGGGNASPTLNGLGTAGTINTGGGGGGCRASGGSGIVVIRYKFQ
jgi:hypothetical protein